MKQSVHSVRTSDQRWGRLFLLLRSFEQAYDACARLDAYPTVPRARSHHHGPGHYARLVSFDRRLLEIERRIDLEFDRLTSDRLRVDLTEKLARTA